MNCSNPVYNRNEVGVKMSVALTAVVVLVIKLVKSCQFHKSGSSTFNGNKGGDELAVT